MQVDLQGFFRRLVPEGMDWLTHTLEGPDDMPAHIRAALLPVSLSIPVSGGRMRLGTLAGDLSLRAPGAAPPPGSGRASRVTGRGSRIVSRQAPPPFFFFFFFFF